MLFLESEKLLRVIARKPREICVEFVMKGKPLFLENGHLRLCLLLRRQRKCSWNDRLRSMKVREAGAEVRTVNGIARERRSEGLLRGRKKAEG